MSLSSEPCLLLFLYQHVLYCQIRFVSSLVEFLPFHLRWREVSLFEEALNVEMALMYLRSCLPSSSVHTVVGPLRFHAESVRHRLPQCKGDSEHTWKETVNLRPGRASLLIPWSLWSATRLILISDKNSLFRQQSSFVSHDPAVKLFCLSICANLQSSEFPCPGNRSRAP